MSNQNNGSWDVEAIMDRKYVDNKPYYYLKWKNYDHSENTWEPKSHLHCTELLEIFEAQRSSQLEEYKQRHATEIGFDRGLEAEFVVGVARVRDKILYGVKWVDSIEADLIDSDEVIDKCSHLILEFYLENIGYRPSTHIGNESIDHRTAEKKTRFNGGSQSADESIERTTPLHILQQKLDNGYTIDMVKTVIQDPITKDVIYKIRWHNIPQDEYVPADFAHRYLQREVVKCFEKKMYVKEKQSSRLLSALNPALECLRMPLDVFDNNHR